MIRENQMNCMHQANRMTSEIRCNIYEFWESGTPPLGESCKSSGPSESDISGASDAFLLELKIHQL